MRKMQSLRAALADALPDLARDSDRLRLWVEEGSAQSRQTDSFGFAFSYRVNVLIVECTTDMALIALAVFRWLRVNQVDLLAPGAEGFSFEADILDNDSADILLRLNLNENVAVTARDDGRHALEYLAEPDPVLPDVFDTDANVPPLREVTLSAEPT